MTPVALDAAIACREEGRSSNTAEIFRVYAGSVSRWARALAGPGADVEDLLQEVFTIVHARHASFRGDSSLSTWLFGITANVVRRRRRGEKLRRWLRGSAQEVAGEVPSSEESALEALERSEARARVYRVLDRMSEKYRNALILFEMEGLSATEIAQLCDAKAGTVWVWLHRARADFLARLKQLEEEEGD
ncbi:MAG: sigma-70 family RNA polymerase sigma factor [Deltaproteobacteria bacterium]|nr:sigma-70 family RNA polymerase sigma factor [Deltaproteobacteria bacterium]